MKTELTCALLNLCSSNASYSNGETIKGSFYLSPSRIDILCCADRTLSSSHAAEKKNHREILNPQRNY
jgi:hypothetical protein